MESVARSRAGIIRRCCGGAALSYWLSICTKGLCKRKSINLVVFILIRMLILLMKYKNLTFKSKVLHNSIKPILIKRKNSYHMGYHLDTYNF